MNPAAVRLLEAKLDKINWFYLSSNPNAMHILKENMDITFKKPSFFLVLKYLKAI